MNPLTLWRVWEIASNIALGAAVTCAATSCMQGAYAAPPPQPPPIYRPAPVHPHSKKKVEYRVAANVNNPVTVPAASGVWCFGPNMPAGGQWQMSPWACAALGGQVRGY